MQNGVLRWAGGKAWLIPNLLPSIPIYKRYFEPFCGGANLFFRLSPVCATLSDLNPLLIQTYEALAKHHVSVIEILTHIPVCSEVYYQVRDELYTTRSLKKRAAYFLYLNHNCWNGLFRENKDGKFNVPYGKPNRKGVRPQINIRAITEAAALLKKVRLGEGDFSHFTKEATSEDLVYLDPPYKLGQRPRAFAEYTSNGFSYKDEERLAEEALRLAQKGAHVLISHASTEEISRLYSKIFFRTIFTRAQTISGNTKGRKTSAEILFSTFPIASTKRPVQLTSGPISVDQRIIADRGCLSGNRLEISVSQVPPQS